MSRSPYRTTPERTDRMPPGVPYIVGNEGAERFSFYGMRAILYVYMTEYLIGLDGAPDVMSVEDATIWQHNFMKFAYAFPIFGAIFCDWLWGKYRTILWLSLLYCVGHGLMALADAPGITGVEPRTLLWWALALIALGAGGIKPCVSAHVGDQFGSMNRSLMSRVFMWYYFAINLGAAASTILTPWLLLNYGPSIAFGVPGVLMALATLVFWMGRHKFVHIPPGGSSFFRDTFSKTGLMAVANLIPLYMLIAVFWCLFDQTTSRWVEQAKHMDRVVFGYDIDPSAHQAANPILVMLLIPLFSHVVYPAIDRFYKLTSLRRIGLGLVIAPTSYFLIAWVQQRIDGGETPHLGWQTLAYVLITSAEVMVSITALEFSYTQAPLKMKSFVTGVFWLSVFLGNQATVSVNEYIKAQQEAGAEVLAGANYYLFFAWAMVVTTVVYLAWSRFYRGRTYLQGEGETSGEPLE